MSEVTCSRTNVPHLHFLVAEVLSHLKLCFGWIGNSRIPVGWWRFWSYMIEARIAEGRDYAEITIVPREWRVHRESAGDIKMALRRMQVWSVESIVIHWPNVDRPSAYTVELTIETEPAIHLTSAKVTGANEKEFPYLGWTCQEAMKISDRAIRGTLPQFFIAAEV